MLHLQFPRRHRRLFSRIGLSVIYVLAALVALRLIRAAGGVSLIWPANAVVAAALIRFREPQTARSLLFIGTAAVLFNIVVAGEASALAVSFALVNVGEIALMVWAYRSRARSLASRTSISQAAQMIAVFGLSIPAVAAVAGGTLIHEAFHRPLMESMFRWWLSHAVGACIFGPPILLASGEAVRRVTSARFGFRNGALALMCITVCYLAIRYIPFPFVVISVPLLIAAINIGAFGTAILSLMCGLEVIGLWIGGILPAGLEPSVHAVALRQLPLWALISTLLPPVLVGLGADAGQRSVNALRKSERRFRETLARSPIGAVIVDMNGVWVETNAALQAMLGYSGEEFRALPFASMTHPDDRADIQRRWEALQTERLDVSEAERRFLHKDGRWILTRTVVSLVKGDEDEPAHFIAQIENIEARRSAERALVSERELLKTALRAIGNAVITTDAERRITYINAAAGEILGQDFADLEMRRFDEVVGLSDSNSSQPAPDLLGQSLALGRVMRRPTAYVLHRPDATALYVIMSVSPLFRSEDEVSGAVIVLQDSTERYQWERELTHQARHDALTGLLNRAEFERRARRAFQRSRLLGETAGLIAIDLDRFKAVNDTGGHAAGDAVLSNVAATLKAIVGQADSVARLGGDEFAIVLENCSPARIEEVASEILVALNPLKTVWIDATYDIGASLGLAAATPGMTDEAEWLSAADQACYAAKRAGRGVLRSATTDCQESAALNAKRNA